MSSDTPCRDRVDAHWAGRREDFERFMQAACKRGVFDVSDSDYYDVSVEYDIDEHEFPWKLVDIFDKVIDQYVTEAEAEAAQRQHRIEKGLDPDTGERPDRDAVLQEFHEYGLCFDYVAPHTFKDQDEGYWRYQLSWGGPSDEIRFYGHFIGNYRCPVYRIEYWFLDWFDGASVTITRDEVAQFVWSEFEDTGAAGDQYQEAMKDYEPPMDDELDPDFEENDDGDQRYLVTAEHRPGLCVWFDTEDAASEWIGAQPDQDAVLAGLYSLEDMRHSESSVRMRVTVTFEYDADPDHYPDHKREPFFMAEVDQYNYYMVDGALIDAINAVPSSQLDITVEPINA